MFFRTKWTTSSFIFWIHINTSIQLTDIIFTHIFTIKKMWSVKYDVHAISQLIWKIF